MIIQPPHFFLKILWLDLKKMMKVDWPQWPRLIVIVKIIQTNWKTFYRKIWNLTKLDWVQPNQTCEQLKSLFMGLFGLYMYMWECLPWFAWTTCTSGIVSMCVGGVMCGVATNHWNFLKCDWSPKFCDLM